jgi:hypothetical protein
MGARSQMWKRPSGLVWQVRQIAGETRKETRRSNSLSLARQVHRAGNEPSSDVLAANGVAYVRSAIPSHQAVMLTMRSAKHSSLIREPPPKFPAVGKALGVWRATRSRS